MLMDQIYKGCNWADFSSWSDITSLSAGWVTLTIDWSSLTSPVYSNLNNKCTIQQHLPWIHPDTDLIQFLSPDSDSAPILKRCKGHLASGPLPGELLLSGGGASQQARGGGQVCLKECIWSHQSHLSSPCFAAFCFFLALKLFMY